MNGFIVANNIAAVRTLLDQEPGQINQTHGLSLSGYTPLIAAARYNRVPIIQLLLERKADPKKTDFQGKTALQWAVNYRHTQAARVLSEATGIPVDLPDDKEDGGSIGTPSSDLENPDDIELPNFTDDERRYAEYFESEGRIPIPRLAIAILVVGTYGDVLPFCLLGRRLLSDGHRVRLASHAEYRQQVTSHGLEFYPLAGDPKELSEFMVKTKGKIIPDSIEGLTVDVPRKTEVMHDIVFSTWPACTAADPDARGPGQPGPPFIADAIISNPPTFGHIHIAEALRVPLHLMFPQPWVPTMMFPHPMACFDKDRQAFSYSKRWCGSNYRSYRLVDELMWGGLAGVVNAFRKSLKLDHLSLGDAASTYVTDCRVPFAHMWSPSFVPKPPDWGPEVDVIGNFFDNDPAAQKFTPDPALKAFLAAGARPILVTFGSMKFDAAPVCQLVYETARTTGIRVLIQSGWSEMKCDIPSPPNVFTMGRAPHDWLMQHTGAVIHHGGAGTTAAGLRYGNPTFVCPFFGDQHFWGAMIERAGLGPSPCPVDRLTPSVLAEKFKSLVDPVVVERARQMAQSFSKEDGVRDAAAVFYRHLPRSTMTCAVCVARGFPMPRIARWRVRNLPLCAACKMVVAAKDSKASFSRAVYRVWGPVGPRNGAEGLAGGTAYLTAEALGGIADIFREPVKGYAESGGEGLAKGIGIGLAKAIWRPTKGAGVMLDKLTTGVVNTFLSPEHQLKDVGGSSVRSLIIGDIAKTLQAVDATVELSVEEQARIYEAFVAIPAS